MKSGKNSDEELNEEVNDKLNQLWTGMKDKRKELVRNLTPGYSRRTDMSELNISNQLHHDKHVVKIRDKLASEVSAGKHKDLQIQHLKKAVAQLTNDKKMLIFELQAHLHDQNSSHALNQSSIECGKPKTIQANTASFSTYKKKKKQKEKANISISEEPQIVQQTQQAEDLHKLSKDRLIELLRSTAEYRQFVYYYDSHQLSYLKRLQIQHRKNCDHSVSQRQKQFWAPSELLDELNVMNEKEKLGLSEYQMEHILSKMKAYYERNQEVKIKKIKQNYQEKLRKAQRDNQNGVPYDLVQIAKVKERQLSKQAARKRATK